MQCENCDSEMKAVHNQSHFQCPGCRRFHFPDSVPCPDGLKSLQKLTDFCCPVCPENRLRIGEISGTQVCFCDQCRGFIIDQASFGDLVEVLRASYDGPDDTPIMLDPDELNKLCLCPACEDLMDTFAYGGPGNVVLDSCRSCRLTWLNSGELGSIVRSPGQREFGANRRRESQALLSQLDSDHGSDSELIVLGGLLG